MKVKDSVVVRPPFEEIHESRIGIEDPAGRGGIALYRFGYPTVVFIRQDPALSMQFSLYVTLGIFLLLAIRDPSGRQSGCRLVKRFTLSVNSLREPKRQEERIESGIPESCPVELPFWTR